MTNSINYYLCLPREAYEELNARERAEVLFTLDLELRKGISCEEIFERWLMCGVPDGCMTVEHVQETMDTESMEWEEFEEYILLAKDCFEEDEELE